MTISKRTRPSKPVLTPADRLVSGLDGEYFKLSEVAEILKVSRSTLRRLLSNEEVKAPSYETKQGKMVVYLYTPDDVKELREFLTPKVTERK